MGGTESSDSHAAHTGGMKEIAKSLIPRRTIEWLKDWQLLRFDRHAKNVLTEEERGFNQMVIYGKDTSVDDVISQAKRFPMMAEHQVVIVKEAQHLSRSIEQFCTYVEKPQQSTVLVVWYKYKKLDKRKKLYKSVSKSGILFESKKLYENQVADWIRRVLSGKGYGISPKSAAMLVEFLGTDLSRIDNELQKLYLTIEKGQEIVPELIEKHIGISKDYNVFEFQKALGQRNVQKANRIVQYFIANPRKNPLQVVIGSLYNYFSKIYLYHSVARATEQEILKALGLRSSFFLREYRAAARQFPMSQTQEVIHLLRQFDMKSKGVDYNATGKPDGELLKEMTWRILHI